MTPRPLYLVRLLNRARMITLRRELATALALAATGVLVMAAGALAVTAVTLRGDLTAAAAMIGASLVVAAALIRGFGRWRQLAGDPLRTATTLVRRPGALPPELAHDLVGAVESLWILEGRALAGHGQVASRELAEAYVTRVDERVRAHLDADLLPPTDTRPLLGVALALGITGAICLTDAGQAALVLLYEARDGRPAPPPEPLWSSLALRLEYPPHTGRPPREVQNPSGGLRVPAGTRVLLEIDPRAPEEALKVVVLEDADANSGSASARVVDLVGAPADRLTGEFTVRAPSTWAITGSGDRSSPSFVIDVEADAAPEVELPPLPAADLEPSELDTIDVRFKARDDFGLSGAVLVFESEGGEVVRLEAGAPPSGAKTWNHRFAWDLSKLALAERPSIEFWIEVRDNDPGLGTTPLLDPPGKVTRSARQRLSVRDQESEHGRNIVGLQEIRDAAVDHLAHRMAADPDRGGIDEARGLLAEDANLLALLATMIDRLSVDALAKDRDAAAVTAIHRRLHALYRDEAALHERIPVDAVAVAGPILGALAGINSRQITGFEDEIIRLDDLVDHQIVDRIEQLVARLQASQQKLLELLERLKAGDTSVQGAIEQLQQRIREDLRRISEAKAQLKKEVDAEFLNLDAFKALQSRLEHEDVLEQVRQGNVDGAIERARGLLDEIRQLRDTVQDRLASAPSERMSPQEKARMRLLRELSRLQDEERSLHSATQAVYQAWRESVSEQELGERDVEFMAREARALRKKIEAINDARLGREGRDSIGDALEHLDRLESARGALDARESAEALGEALRRAQAGAKRGEREAGQIERASADAARMIARARDVLPNTGERADEAATARLTALSEQQRALRGRAKALQDEGDAEQLPDPGKAALRGAATSMERGADRLREAATGDALRDEDEALRQIQRAIDSLRSSAPPPSGATGPASTESERDRSLRDEVMDAMRERPPEGFSEPVKRYYEEILR